MVGDKYNMVEFITIFILMSSLSTRFGLLTNRNITWFKQLNVQTNRKIESKFRFAGKYYLTFLISRILMMNRKVIKNRLTGEE